MKKNSKVVKDFKTIEQVKEDLIELNDKGTALTQDDVFKAVEHLDMSPEETDDLFSWLKDNDISLQEDGDEEPKEIEVLDDDDIDIDLEDEDDINSEVNSYKDVPIHFGASNTYSKINDPVKMYLKDIGQVDLLKPEQEPEIARNTNDGEIAKKILKYSDIETMDLKELEKVTKDIDKDPTKNSEFLSKCVKKGLEGEAFSQAELNKLNDIVSVGEEAKNMLISANLRLVVSIAKKYVGRGMLFLDLIQEGNMGLVKAVEKFDYTKGFKFSTYATWWIRQAITRAIADQARTIRIPVHMVETINKLSRVQRQLVQELGRDPSAEEISARMDGISPEKVREIQRIALDPVSLETPIGEEDDSHLGDFIEDKDAMSPDRYTNIQLLKDEINSVLQLLTEREEKVLRLRFGLEDGRNRTLEEVGKEFNVTRERIRQIEAKALRKLRHPTKSKRLKEFKENM